MSNDKRMFLAILPFLTFALGLLVAVIVVMVIELAGR